MLAELLVMFRESLEAVLVLGIVLSYLYYSKQQKYCNYVYSGAVAGLFASVLAAFLFESFLGGFEANEESFEGLVMLAAALLVTWLLLWLFSKGPVNEMKENTKKLADSGSVIGLFLLSFIAVFREGVESVLFMYGILAGTGTISLFGALLGLSLAVLIGLLFFKFSLKFNFATFFRISALLLILLAAGLFSKGVHELQEAKVLPTYVEHVYDLNPAQNADESYPPLHEKGVIGSSLAALIGYDGNPSDLQVISYFAYLVFAFYLYRRAARVPTLS
jgi:high-affinity iron transporter